MTSRVLKFLAPALVAAFISGAAVSTANAAPVQKAVFDGGSAQVMLVDHRDGRGRGDRDRHYRGRDNDRRYYRGDYYRPYYPPPYRAPRYVYAPPPPPAYYYPYDGYYYYGAPRSTFSFSSPNLGLSFGY